MSVKISAAPRRCRKRSVWTAVSVLLTGCLAAVLLTGSAKTDPPPDAATRARLLDAVGSVYGLSDDNTVEADGATRTVDGVLCYLVRIRFASDGSTAAIYAVTPDGGRLFFYDGVSGSYSECVRLTDGERAALTARIDAVFPLSGDDRVAFDSCLRKVGGRDCYIAYVETPNPYAPVANNRAILALERGGTTAYLQNKLTGDYEPVSAP